MLITLVEFGGMLERRASGIDRLAPVQRSMLTKLGVRVGALDLFVPAMLRPRALALWRELALLLGRKLAPPDPGMPPVLAATSRSSPPGYRPLCKQLLRLDMAEKLLREAHASRVCAGRRSFALDPARAISCGLTTGSYARLLRTAGFHPLLPRQLGECESGPPAPLLWRWRPPRSATESVTPPPHRPHGAFAALAELVQ